MGWVMSSVRYFDYPSNSYGYLYSFTEFYLRDMMNTYFFSELFRPFTSPFGFLLGAYFAPFYVSPSAPYPELTVSYSPCCYSYSFYRLFGLSDYSYVFADERGRLYRTSDISKVLFSIPFRFVQIAPLSVITSYMKRVPCSSPLYVVDIETDNFVYHVVYSPNAVSDVYDVLSSPCYEPACCLTSHIIAFPKFLPAFCCDTY